MSDMNYRYFLKNGGEHYGLKAQREGNVGNGSWHSRRQKKEESTPILCGNTVHKALKPDQVKHVGSNTELEYEGPEEQLF